MAVTRVPAFLTRLTGADTVLTWTPPAGGTAREGDLVVDDSGNVGTVTLVAGTLAVQPLANAVTLAGGLTSAGGNPNATPSGTLSVTVTRGGAAVANALLAVVFDFAATEFPTFGVPAAGTLLGGRLGLTESQTQLVQTDASGVFTATVAMPTAGARTVTPVAFRVLAYGQNSNILNSSAVVLGGP